MLNVGLPVYICSVFVRYYLANIILVFGTGHQRGISFQNIFWNHSSYNISQGGSRNEICNPYSENKQIKYLSSFDFINFISYINGTLMLFCMFTV